MRILVIGGTGFIGPFVVRSLHEQGHSVLIYHRGQNEAELPDGVKHIHCGAAARDSLAWIQRLPDFFKDFTRFAPHVVLYMRPLGRQDSRLVMDAFKGIAQRVVGISSGDVYRAYGRLNGSEPGPPDAVPLTEDAPLREKLFPYRGEKLRAKDDPNRWQDDYEKILAERAIMGDPRLPGTILRLPMVYGPRDNQHRLFPYLKRMDDQRPTILLDRDSAGWHWTRGYVENVAAAIALATTNVRAAGRIYNVGESTALAMKDWVRAIGTAAGWQGELIKVPEEQLPAHLATGFAVNQDLVVDTTRLRRELGYSETVPLDEALKRTVEWERANTPKEVDDSQFDYAAEDALVHQVHQDEKV